MENNTNPIRYLPINQSNIYVCIYIYIFELCPSDSDFPPIENPVFQNQLRVLNVLDESFEIDMVSLYNEFMLTKKRNKRKYYKSNFAQSEKDCVKRKWLEKMNQLKKHILFFYFLENYYVSKDEVSKHHLNVI